jgi:hypothetical protein
MPKVRHSNRYNAAVPVTIPSALIYRLLFLSARWKRSRHTNEMTIQPIFQTRENGSPRIIGWMRSP